MTVQSGFVKHKRYHTNDDYTKSIISEWTREETVEMNDGTRTLNDVMDATHNKLNYGQGTVANSDNQTVLGKYNVADNNNTYARITGGGTPATPQNIETLDWQGNVKFAGTITTGNNINLNNIFDLIYPVGALYWSKNPTNPSQLFGGTWRQIKDTFILAAGDTHTIGDDGGSEYTEFTYSGSVNGHALNISELPSHSHKYTEATAVESHILTENELPAHTHGLGNNASGTTGQGGTHTHGYGMYIPIAAPGGTDDQHPIEVVQTGGLDTVQTLESTHSHSVTLSGATESKGGSNGHTHNLTTNPNADTGSVGNGQNHNHTLSISVNEIPNMPPFVTYYCWERTA